MNAENTAAVIGLLASIVADYAGGSADTIAKECHEWMAASAATISILWSPVCVGADRETRAKPKVRNGSRGAVRTGYQADNLYH
jgi:hypothetical protein